jgi:hypothetical protein
MASGLGSGPNYAFPDTGAVYWTAKFTMPAGSRIVFKGRYAHAGYESLNSYDGTTNAPIDAINDISTSPNRGSSNPFLPGANRAATKRSYAITVLDQPVPTSLARNTLYAGAAGQYSNIDNNYIYATVNRGFPAGQVLVLHGKLPTTPTTGPTIKRMGTAQLRYWPMCQNESLFTTRGAGCVYDAQVPVDKHGYYTIVTSLAKDRPADATARCGVAYITWPTRGDGDGRLNDGLLLMR